MKLRMLKNLAFAKKRYLKGDEVEVTNEKHAKIFLAAKIAVAVTEDEAATAAVTKPEVKKPAAAAKKPAAAPKQTYHRRDMKAR